MKCYSSSETKAFKKVPQKSSGWKLMTKRNKSSKKCPQIDILPRHFMDEKRDMTLQNQ